MLYYVLALHALRHVGSMLEVLRALHRQSLVCTPPQTHTHNTGEADTKRKSVRVGRVTGARETMTAAREKRGETRRERDEEGGARETSEGGPVVGLVKHLPRACHFGRRRRLLGHLLPSRHLLVALLHLLVARLHLLADPCLATCAL
jgi:hypothetical protein